MITTERLSPGQDCQAVAIAHELGQPVENIHGDTLAVVGNLGDSICYAGVREKVDAVQAALGNRIIEQHLPNRLIGPMFTVGISDGMRNGTPEMRFSLIGREITAESASLHLEANGVQGAVAVVACDKPPVGTLSAILERNVPSIIMSDGSIKPGTDPLTGEKIDLVSCFQIAGDPDEEKQRRYAENACPGKGSCGGMFTYNTIQSFIATLGMEPLHMVSPASEDPRRVEQFPNELIDSLQVMMERDIRPKNIVTPASLRNAMIVAIAMGGSTNVVLHAPEIAQAAGIDFWKDVMTQNQFNSIARKVPVLVNARPFGKYSMVDIDAEGGLQVIIKELLDAKFLDGSCITCTGETLQEQVDRLNPPAPDGDVIRTVAEPYKETGGLRLLRGNLAPDGGAVIKIAGVEGGIEDGKFTGTARVFNSEASLLAMLRNDPDVFQDKDMVVIRYEGPRGAPGMPEMLDPTSRLTALCRKKGITVALMTDARFSGGSVGLCIGHVGPEASLGGPIALLEDGDTIEVDLNEDTLTCKELEDTGTYTARQTLWQEAARENGGEHPSIKVVTNRVLRRMRATAATAINGAGMSAAMG
ncbi:MAG TPA: dihydroxy-acid dehydratase [Candidatus Saccharimonadales bacterium]|jgi:dihydroxy-acid dehydratase|nr:dihydroxy-acid dehydratase [Candidatus Saccharimonadales bacterium]